ncbi:tripartite tricarboxylate transporter substrate binding protein [Roseomonas hellenica]|uniref:Tripartite tricarboxylate transporter substrate binding protein n=1 Tax=Plastoroseomonas hellenica TaxID=2687306 RepID=A0ABS5ES25_9PROT|nr:tripartite tricarboxylate transporter substrate binding protein [Plastoroseomonas hellenica]MBR0663078.1 tripartite tricarboxylate transporter substrate binding protein [Plastoroseomonas hellenica]
MLGRRGLGAAALGLAAARQALAQDAARGPVTIIVPWAPGGSADTLARLLAQKLSQDLGQSFVVENRPGASGIIGHAAVARARPDGSTILFAASATYAMVPHLLPLPYDNATAFAPIGLILSTPLVVCVSPRLGVTDLQGLVARAKAAPGRLSYGSAGAGSTTHLATEMLLGMAGIEVTEVPYRGNAPALQAVLADEVQFTSVDAPVALPFVRSGDLRAVAVTTRGRSPLLPEVPSIAEAGYPDYECATEFALLAPAGTPAAVTARLQAAVAAALRAPDMQEKLAQQAVVASIGTPAEFPAYLARENARWSRLIRERNIRVQQ